MPRPPSRVAQGGLYTLTWDGRDFNGNAIGSGLYFYRMTAGEFSETRSMTLLK